MPKIRVEIWIDIRFQDIKPGLVVRGTYPFGDLKTDPLLVEHKTSKFFQTGDARFYDAEYSKWEVNSVHYQD